MLFISTFMYFIQVMSSHRRPSFSAIFPNPVYSTPTHKVNNRSEHNRSSVASEGIQKAWRMQLDTHVRARERQSYIHVGRQCSQGK